MAAIEVRDLVKTYVLSETHRVEALRGLTLSVDKGEFLSVLGPSGSGKSTLMHILGCLDQPTSGEYRLMGRDVARLGADERARIRNEEIGFVFQSFHLLARASALENVELPMLYGAKRPGREDRRQMASEALEAVRLSRPRHPRAEPALGGAAAAGRHRQGAGQPAAPAAGRRTDRQPRHPDRTGNPRYVRPPELRARTDRHHDHPRPAGGAVRLPAASNCATDAFSRTRQSRVTEQPPMLNRIPLNREQIQTLVREMPAERRTAVETALQSLRRYPLRTALTLLGLAFGVAALMATIALGRGAQGAIRDQVRAAGLNVIEITAGNYRTRGERPDRRRRSAGTARGRPAAGRAGAVPPEDRAGRARAPRERPHGKARPPDGPRSGSGTRPRVSAPPPP